MDTTHVYRNTTIPQPTWQLTQDPTLLLLDALQRHVLRMLELKLCALQKTMKEEGHGIAALCKSLYSVSMLLLRLLGALGIAITIGRFANPIGVQLSKA